MPNYDVHVLSGIVSYPAVVVLAGLLSPTLHFGLTPTALILGYALYVLGSDLPDMDHPNALIHRGTKPIVSVSVGGAVYLWVIRYLHLGAEWLNQSAAWTVGAVGAFIAWFGFTAVMPRHRGVVHSLFFAAIYGFLAFLLAGYGLGMSFGEALYSGFAAFSGYTLHLTLDGSLKLV